MKTKSGASFVRQYLLITITSTLLFFLIGVFSVRWLLSDSKQENRNNSLLPLVLKLETGELNPIEQRKLYGLYGDSSKDFPFVFTIIAVGLILSILTSTFSILFYLRKKAKIAEVVMDDLKAGKLDSRFPTEKFDEFTHLMNHFNDMAEQIKNLVLELKEKDQKRKELVQEISHDLKTPLSSLLMSADMLEKSTDSNAEKKKQIVEEIKNEGEYIAILLDDLLFLSIVEDPNFRIHKKDFDLVGLLADVVKTANQKFPTIKSAW